MVNVRLAGVALLGLACIAGPLEAQQANGAQRAPRRSWTADRQEFAVGDVITVLIDEYTLASANKGTFASDSRSRDLGLGVSQNVTAALPPLSADVASSVDARSQQSGEATRQNRFQGEMTVRVTEIEAGGLVRVEGLKVVDIDGNREELVLRGWLRPQDVSPGNLIDSWRLGDAELVYTGNNLGKPKGGFIGKLLGALWP
jgi:flagellar L-ring protein FlgH